MQDNYRTEDQGEWERCRSARRMFLALTDAGKEKDLRLIAQIALGLAGTHIPERPQALEAAMYWAQGLKDPTSNKPEKELADRVYLVLRYVADGFDAGPGPWGALTGDMIVAKVIRKQVPLAPSGFRKVGKREGASADASISARMAPHRAFFEQILH